MSFIKIIMWFITIQMTWNCILGTAWKRASHHTHINSIIFIPHNAKLLNNKPIYHLDDHSVQHENLFASYKPSVTHDSKFIPFALSVSVFFFYKHIDKRMREASERANETTMMLKCTNFFILILSWSIAVV